MIWFFDRQGQRLRYEIRRTTAGDAYELVVSYPDGREEVEQMLEPSDLLKRCAELADSLKDQGWKANEPA
jgi:hypothetical protein